MYNNPFVLSLSHYYYSGVLSDRADDSAIEGQQVTVSRSGTFQLSQKV